MGSENEAIKTPGTCEVYLGIDYKSGLLRPPVVYWISGSTASAPGLQCTNARLLDLREDLLAVGVAFTRKINLLYLSALSPKSSWPSEFKR